MPEIELAELGSRAGFLGLALLIAFVGRFLRDLVALARGYKVRELITQKDNLAAAIDLSGYLLALIFALLNSLVISSETWLGQASDIALTGLVVIVLLLFAEWVADLAIFRKMDDHKELYENENVSLAFGRAGAALATGLVVAGALGDAETRGAITGFDASLWHCLAWFAVGQVAMVIMSLLYQWITPYDDLAEIKNNNVAAALPITGILLAVGLIIHAGVHGETTDWAHDLTSVGLYLLCAGILLYFLRILTDRFLLPGTKLAKEIAEDKNAGAGLLEGTTFVIGALLLTYFMG